MFTWLLQSARCKSRKVDQVMNFNLIGSYSEKSTAKSPSVVLTDSRGSTSSSSLPVAGMGSLFGSALCSRLLRFSLLFIFFFKRFWAGFQIPPTWWWGGGGNFSNTCRFLDTKIKRSSCKKLEIFLQQPKNWINRHNLSLYLLLIKLINSLKLSKIFPI